MKSEEPQPPEPGSGEPFDLLIRGGSVVDGTGSPAFPADVAVRSDRIAAVGEVAGPARRVIEARGLVVAPGFIDVHAHDDAAVLATPAMDFKLMQGVTTDIVGNCGAGVAPADDAFPDYFRAGVANVLGPLPEQRPDGRPSVPWRSFGEYMAAVDEARPALNVGCLVPHGVVRFAALRLERRSPGAGELAAMREMVDEAMAAGALGLSTGLIYPPGSFAETEEIIELAKVAAAAGGVYASHIRDEAERLLEAVAEAVEVGRKAGLPVQISHHKAGAPPIWGKTKESIAFIEKERQEGMDITFDVYPYTAGSTVLAAIAGAGREYDTDTVLVASVSGRREFEGKTLTELAALLGVEPREAAARVLSEEPAAVAVFFCMDEADVQRVLAHPLCMIGSDGIPSASGKPHPRLYGTFPRVLGRYVREEGLLGLEEGVRKMSGLPARRFGLKERGELQEGWLADVVVFDPRTVADRATYQEPRQYPAGVEYVIVNGEVAAEGGRQTAARAGRVLRRG